MKLPILRFLSVVLLLVNLSCSNEKSVQSKPPETINQPLIAIVNTALVAQLIDGFGGSTAWTGQISDSEAYTLFGNQTSDQLGLSIIRVRIDPDNNWFNEKANADKASALGAKVFASPWSPPAAMKTNNNVVGGSLIPSKYGDYATWLNSFSTYMGNLSAISLQNEPNINVNYESCLWNATEMLSFVKNNASAIGVPVVMPETYNFDFSYSDPILNDPTAITNFTYVGGHIYGTAIKKYNNAINKGKRIWMTEHYFDANDIDTGIQTAKEIHDCMTIANHSAYIWWTLKAFDCYIIKDGVLNTKGYMIGQYSKFIRPGYYRIETTNNPVPNLYVSGYKGDNKVIVVAINTGNTVIKQSFVIQNTIVNSVTPYVTTNNQNIGKGENIMTVNGNFTAVLPAKSVTTFVSN